MGFRVLAATVAVTLLVAVAGCALGAVAPVRLSDADSGKAAQLQVGGSLVIDLEENVTTGYSWRVDGALPPQLKAASDKAKPSGQTGVVGAAGRRVLTYTAVAAGTGQLRLVYVRPWEKGVAPAKTFTASITVR